jgi:hypothetical protein
VLPGRISITYTHDIAETYAIYAQFLSGVCMRGRWHTMHIVL